MKIAYIILAHRDPAQLKRLIEAINVNCRIYVHIDKKVNEEQFRKMDMPGNVSFIEDRVKVYWGGFSQVEATVNLLKAAAASGEDFSHVVFLTGLDYPIQPIERFYELLTANPNRQFIRFINIRDSPEYYMKISSHYYFRDQLFPFDWIFRKVLTKISRHQNLILKKRLKNIKQAFGFANWAITFECAAYILDFIERNPDFVRYYKTYDCPDEYFFHTIIANSPFYKETEGFYPYKGRGTPKYSCLHTFRSTRYDKVYELKDFEVIKNSGKYFARKITTEKSMPLIRRINGELLYAEAEVKI